MRHERAAIGWGKDDMGQERPGINLGRRRLVWIRRGLGRARRDLL